MGKGIINQELLEKDIEYIDFYSNEENKLLNELNSEFQNMKEFYSSDNTFLFLKTVSDFSEDIKKILVKRNLYSVILNAVISLYHETTIEARKKIEGEDEI